MTVNIVRNIWSGKQAMALNVIELASREECAFPDKHGKAPLHFAAEAGMDKVLMALLVDKDVDVHPKTINGWTPLHHAAFKSHPSTIKLLVDTGKARVNSLTNEAFTPLHYAAAVLSLECCEALILRRADVNAINSYNETPFDAVGTLVKRELLCKQKKAKVMAMLEKENGQSGSDVQKRLSYTAVKRLSRAVRW